jgi:hypothetical protein
VALLQPQGRVALIPYITAGDPEPWVTVPLMHALVAAGADVLELGVPFSDPMADGPVIQQAAERALKHHVSLKHVFGMVREFRKQDSSTPVVLMGYLNPIEVLGYKEFAGDAAAASSDERSNDERGYHAEWHARGEFQPTARSDGCANRHAQYGRQRRHANVYQCAQSDWRRCGDGLPGGRTCV